GAPVAFDVERNGEILRIAASPVMMCDFPVSVSDKAELNAHADGHSVVIDGGMMDFARSDAELATVIGHEMAHDLRRHRATKAANQAIGAVADLAAALVGSRTNNGFARIGAGAFGQDFEREADYVGLYLMARAGFPLDESANLWRRMAVANPGT